MISLSYQYPHAEEQIATEDHVEVRNNVVR
jgi:hypothetical protein